MIVPTTRDRGLAPFLPPSSIAITDRGLVCEPGAVLSPFTDPAKTSNRLAIDPGRVVAMLSVVAGAPLPAAAVLPQVEAAVDHWHRGDKALANLRLVFARLPRPSDPSALVRMAQAEWLLDGGMAPASLMNALWPKPAGDRNGKRYDPDEPRVPSGQA